MSTGEIWQFEKSLWTDGADVYEQRVAADCLMVFPPPVGILSRDAALQGLKNAPRWSSVEMTKREEARPSDTTVILAYQADAEREGDETYRALCSSTYRHMGAQWQLIQHQHTPIEA